jgi:hypothetical protein
MVDWISRSRMKSLVRVGRGECRLASQQTVFHEKIVGGDEGHGVPSGLVEKAVPFIGCDKIFNGFQAQWKKNLHAALFSSGSLVNVRLVGMPVVFGCGRHFAGQG